MVKVVTVEIEDSGLSLTDEMKKKVKAWERSNKRPACGTIKVGKIDITNWDAKFVRDVLSSYDKLLEEQEYDRRCAIKIRNVCRSNSEYNIKL